MTTTVTTRSTNGPGVADSRVSVRPVDPGTWIGPPEDNEAYGRGRKTHEYIKVSFTPASGELTADWNESYDSRYRSSWGPKEPEDFRKEALSGVSVSAGSQCPDREPELITRYDWLVSGYANAVEVNTMLTLLARLIPTMLDAYAPVPGRPGCLDWTPTAASYARLIATLVKGIRYYLPDGQPAKDNLQRALDERASTEKRYITWSQLHQLNPHLAPGELALAGDAELDAAAREVTSRLYGSYGHDLLLPESVGRPFTLLVTSARIGLHEFRRDAAEGLRVVDATDWYADHPGVEARMQPGWTDEDLANLLQPDEERTAANAGVRLVGLPTYLTQRRTLQREQARAELRRLAGLATHNSTPQRRRAVAGLLLTIDGWDDPADGTEDRDQRLGDLAGMSPEAVALLRTRIGGVEAWDGWVPVVLVRAASPERRRRWFGQTVK
ncbi:hypothetical protein [Kitasatospora sp. GP82]|uniref:hypothetical protein n=1 Tax=Kitasatospora sp. GP82 TaxID=3035089 RepID=UPI002475E432|nr:hypothetical protein [Kitasatospora sp. GP82]MDH6129391.1 hypothetical protein [Kitasatospora sp. GP82]